MVTVYITSIVMNKFQNSALTNVPEKSFSKKFRKIHWKAQTMKSFFVNRRTPLQVFSWDFYEFFRTLRREQTGLCIFVRY